LLIPTKNPQSPLRDDVQTSDVCKTLFPTQGPFLHFPPTLHAAIVRLQVGHRRFNLPHLLASKSVSSASLPVRLTDQFIEPPLCATGHWRQQQGHARAGRSAHLKQGASAGQRRRRRSIMPTFQTARTVNPAFNREFHGFRPIAHTKAHDECPLKP